MAPGSGSAGGKGDHVGRSPRRGRWRRLRVRALQDDTERAREAQYVLASWDAETLHDLQIQERAVHDNDLGAQLDQDRQVTLSAGASAVDRLQHLLHAPGNGTNASGEILYNQPPVRSRSLSTVAPRVRSSLPPGRPILIVDDDPIARLVIAGCLAELGLSNPAVEVGDGEAAMAILQLGIEGAEDRLPTLVLLDLRMPGCSGQQVFEWMRDDPTLARVPVIVLTGDDDPETVTTLYRLGVHSYLVKPVGFAALASVIRDLNLPWMLT